MHGGLLAAKSQHHHHHHHHWENEETDGDNSPARTSKLFRPYLDADDPPKPALGVQADEGPLLTTKVIRGGPVDRNETTSRDGGSPRVTSVSQASTRKYACDLCGRTFSRSNTLVTHRVCNCLSFCYCLHQNVFFFFKKNRLKCRLSHFRHQYTIFRLYILEM